MEQHVTLYDSIYRDIVTEIYIGSYKKGDPLPSTAQLCEKYSAGRNTLRSALQLLEQYGYIKQASGKRAVVTFDFQNPDYRARYLLELSQRRSAIEDVFETLVLIIPDIAVYCLKSCSDEERIAVADVIDEVLAKDVQTENEMSQALNHVYTAVLSYLHNALLLDLYKALYQFMLVPLTITDRKGSTFQMIQPTIRFFFKRFGSSIRNKNLQALQRQFVFFCRTISKTILSYLDRICADMPAAEQMKFTWIIQRHKKELLYNTVVTKILKQIQQGVYHPGDVLPSYAEIARDFDVSEKTSRKAIAILNRLKIVQTTNGKRTMVLQNAFENLKSFVEDPFTQHNLLIFFEALQLLLIFSKPVALSAMKQITESQLESVEQQVERQYQETSSFSLEIFLDLFFLSIPSAVLADIYQHLKKEMDWGTFLDFYYQRNSELLLTEVRSILTSLRERNDGQTAELFYKMFYRIFMTTQTHMEKIGLQIELIALPYNNF